MIILHQTDTQPILINSDVSPDYLSRSIVINPSYISSMCDKGDHTKIYMSSDRTFYVKETVEEILDMIDNDIYYNTVRLA